MNKSKRLKEIKVRRYEIGQDIRDYKFGEAYTKLKDEFDEKVEKYYKKIEPELKALKEEQSALFDEETELKNAPKKNVIQLSERLKEWLKEYLTGCDWGYKDPFIKEILDKEERFVLISNPGGSYSSGMSRDYGKAGHWVTDTFVCKRAYGNERCEGISAGKIGSLEIEGRLNKEEREKLLNAVEEYKKLIKFP